MKFSGKSISAAGLTAALFAGGAMSVSAVAHADDTSPRSAEQTQPASGADADLVNRVREALHSAKYLNSRHITVDMQDGDVVLKGFVPDNRALLTATQVATKAAGDHKIVNNLSIEQNYRNGHGT